MAFSIQCNDDPAETGHPFSCYSLFLKLLSLSFCNMYAQQNKSLLMLWEQAQRKLQILMEVFH